MGRSVDTTRQSADHRHASVADHRHASVAQVRAKSLGHLTRIGRSGARPDQRYGDRAEETWRSRNPQHQGWLWDLSQPWRILTVAEWQCQKAILG